MALGKTLGDLPAMRFRPSGDVGTEPVHDAGQLHRAAAPPVSPASTVPAVSVASASFPRASLAEPAGGDPQGYVAEGTGENIFVVKKGVVYTPDLSVGALNGITRDTVVAICGDLGLNLVEKRITRDEVYICDEAFFTGTAAEVTPIRELDGRQIGAGRRGPVTEKLQKAYFDLVTGKTAAHAEWRTLVK